MLIAEIEALCDAGRRAAAAFASWASRREQIPALVRDSRGSSMSGNPRELSDDELTAILEELL